MKLALRILATFALGCALSASAGEIVRTYPLTGHGTLKLNVPSDWRADVRTNGNLPPTITFSARVGCAFEILVTRYGKRAPACPRPPTKTCNS
jgi:hypothetical protein